MTVETKKLNRSFSGREVLEDADVSIPGGTLVGLYGPSGIGKSTLARILCGVLKPDSGEVLLDGKRLFSADTPYDRRRGLTIQMVWQQPYATLDPRQRIGAGFTELLRYHRLCGRGEEEERIRTMLQSVGLSEKILGQLPLIPACLSWMRPPRCWTFRRRPTFSARSAGKRPNTAARSC